MSFDYKALLNLILELLQLGKSMNLFDKDGKPINTVEDLHQHLLDQNNE